jgi:hypothetical protein
MKELVQWIKSTYNFTSIPVRIKNEKRWESMDEIIVREPFEGIPQRVDLEDGYGLIIYEWDIIDDSVINEIKSYYHKNNGTN